MTRETAYCFAADLGGTKLAAAVADARGRIVAELTEPTDPRGGAYVAEQIAACADKLARAVGIEVTPTRHVMVGVPGAIDPRTGRVSLVPNIPGLQDFDVLGYLRGRFGPDVAIENDVNLAMFGEQALGCARGCHNAAFLALGTGAGLGLFIDDKLLFRGARSNFADPIQHRHIRARGRLTRHRRSIPPPGWNRGRHGARHFQAPEGRRRSSGVGP
jgi:predicted NBD/HSP70 family sugar kinase